MPDRLTFVSLIVLLAAGLGGPSAVAENPYKLKPGATGELCLDCHVTFDDTMQMASVHTPLSTGECTGCHNPHATSHGGLLASAASEVCVQCHDGLVPDSPRSAHPAVLAGECGTCHDPHASDEPNNLLMSGRDLCSTCHSDVVDAAESATFKHAPMESGCMSCHDAHASADAPALLREDVPGLCAGCHDPTRASFREQHQGYPVAESDCSSCHDPHGSDNGGMLWATVHKPVATKMCRQCHGEPPTGGSMATARSGEEQCRACHNTEMNRIAARSTLHWPLADAESCGHCHSPHASKEAGLLHDTPIAVCGQCHADTIAQQRSSLTKHTPLEDGNCAACHDPHASDSPFLMVEAGTIELCGACHDWETHSTHPIGPTVVDTRNGNLSLDCSSCHLSHGSEFKHFAPFDPAADLCVDCHEQFRR